MCHFRGPRFFQSTGEFIGGVADVGAADHGHGGPGGRGAAPAELSHQAGGVGWLRNRWLSLGISSDGRLTFWVRLPGFAWLRLGSTSGFGSSSSDGFGDVKVGVVPFNL